MHEPTEQSLADPGMVSVSAAAPEGEGQSVKNPPPAALIVGGEPRVKPAVPESKEVVPEAPPPPLEPKAPLVTAPLLPAVTPPPTASAKPEMPAPANAEVTYWLGRKPDPARNEMVFDVRVPADLAALITCSDPRYAAFQRTTVQQFDWQSGDRQHTLLRNQLAWDKDGLDAGQLYLRFGRRPNDTTKLATTDPDWKACNDVLLAQSMGFLGDSRSVKGADLNSDRYTQLPFYGVTGAGSGRLAVGPTHVAAIFSRSHYTPSDNLVHQEANDFLALRNLTQVGIKAGNTVSHSFDQRLIFDGKDFITLHKGDSYPYAGLIIEKLVTQRPHIARANAFACPTFGNNVFFDLGGVAAEADGYPILFTASRNTSAVSQGKPAKGPYDLALVYVVRDFEARPRPKNPYDTLSILANGYAPDQEFKIDNFTWNPAASQFNNKEQRHIRRRVLWLTENGPNTLAMNAKLVKLRDGQYIAFWDEQGEKPATRAMTISIQGPITAKTITKGEPVELKLAGPGGVKLPMGDDAFSISINGKPHAAWLTAGRSPQQFLLHTVDGELVYKAYPLTLP